MGSSARVVLLACCLTRIGCGSSNNTGDGGHVTDSITYDLVVADTGKFASDTGKTDLELLHGGKRHV